MLSRPQHRRLFLLIVLFMGGAWWHGRVLPPLEGGDEWLQLAYIDHIRATGTLPDRADTSGPARQQSGQPPLTYAIGALPGIVRGLPLIDTAAMWDALQRDSNNWFAPPYRFNRTDNNNVFYLSNEPANTPSIVRVNRAARWIAPLWGVVGLLATYAAAYERFRRAGPALGAAALFALLPTHLHISSFPNTDGGAAALGAVVLWLALRAARGQVGIGWALGAGLALGLGGLAKVSVLLLGPALALGAVIGVGRSGGRWRRMIVLGVGGVAPVAITFGAWAAWGWLAYGDPLGTQTHRFEGQFYDPPLGVLAVLTRLPEVYLSYWGKFGSAVYLHPITYIVLSGVLVLALFGRMGGRGDLRLQAILWLATGSALAGLWYWLSTINFITGRLLFPAHAALAILIVAGLDRYGPNVRAVAVGIPAVTGLILAPAIIGAAYRPPPPVDPPPTLTQTVFDYDDAIRLIGWQPLTATLTNNAPYRVRLCWEVLDTAPRPAAYSIRVVRDGVSIGERTTVHGLGRYDWRQWEPGHRFCDVVEVPIREADPATRYDLLLVLLDAQTGAVNWQATTPDGTTVQFPVLGQVGGRE